MVSKSKKYFTSPWLVFLLKGALSSVAGLALILTFGNVEHSTQLAGVYMLALGTIEFFNFIHHRRRQTAGWLPLTVSAVQILIAAILLSTAVPNFLTQLLGQQYSEIQGSVLAFRLVTLACYTIFAALASLILALTSFDNYTDRFIWLMEGMFGIVMGLVMLAENGLATNTHLHIFGIYSLVKGLTDMIYSVHVHESAVNAKLARDNSRESARSTVKKTVKKGQKA